MIVEINRVAGRAGPPANVSPSFQHEDPALKTPLLSQQDMVAHAFESISLARKDQSATIPVELCFTGLATLARASYDRC
jgi:hypothetical protein